MHFPSVCMRSIPLLDYLQIRVKKKVYLMKEKYRKSDYIHLVYRKESSDYLMYSFRTRRFIVLNELQKFLFDNAPYDELDSPFLQSLYDHGFLVDFDEYEALKKRQKERQEEDRAIHLGIVPTMGCNFQCDYCIETNQVRGGRMSEEVQKQVVTFAKGLLQDADSFSPVWFGGEPMLYMKPIVSIGKELKQYCDERHIPLWGTIYTNGYFLTPENIRLLEEAGVRTVRISVDGSRESHDRMRHLPDGSGSYDRILSNLSVPTSMTYRIRCNMNRKNLGDYEILVHTLKEIAKKSGNRIIVSAERMRVEKDVNRGLKAIELTYPEYYDFFQKVSDLTVDTDEERVLQLLRGKSTGVVCNAARKNSYQIDERGNIYKCNWFLGKDDHVIGNVADHPSREELNSTKEARYFMERRMTDREKCRKCRMLPVCLGRCPLSWEEKDRYDCVRDLNNLDALLPKAYEAYLHMFC